MVPKDELMKSDRQVAMVFDLNKCIGCQTCSVACKVLWMRGMRDEGMDYQWWCTVNTQPGRGHPRDYENMGGGYRDGVPFPGIRPTREEWGGGWDFNYDEVFYSGKGPSVYLKPLGEPPTWGPNWDEDQGGGEYPNSFFFYLPRLCNHCTRPICIEACPRNAMYKRKEDGIVLRDETRCRGYQFCLEACPYKKVYFNYVKKISQQCILCYPRIEKGVAPACARQCPGRLVFVGYLDDKNGPVHKLVNEWEVALPLHPEYGTIPNMFYIPPLAPYRLNDDGSIDESTPRIPTEYLERLFGPRVNKALDTLKAEMAKTRSKEQSELMDMLIVYKWRELFKPFDRDPAELQWK
jgi:ethylbenzene hydroxylase subunit beta/complex iron-sulfur molybdoenzyme family reductase subunit beta